MTSDARGATVVLIEDQGVLSGALRSAISTKTDMRITGVAATLAQGVEVVRRRRPDVVVSDYRLPDGDLPDRLAEILATDPAPRVLVFTGWSDEASLVRAMDAGAAGFVDKASFDDFIDALRRVAAGEVVVSPRLVPLLARRALGAGDTVLTIRELEVLELLARGASTEQIADTLIVAANTVRNYISKTLAKLGAHSRLEAVRIGVERGLIRYDPPTG